MVVAGLLASGCVESTSGPPRPAGLPAEAFWLGGPDGGVFVELQRAEGPSLPQYSGAVYHPDGSLWYKGRFTLEPSGGAPVDLKDRGQFAGWDGTRILLKDGRALLAR